MKTLGYYPGYLSGLALLVTLLFAGTPLQAKITEAECKADYDAMVQEAGQNRQHSLDELDRMLRYTADDEAAAHINQMINESWELEASYLSIAANLFRDCVNYARSPGS